MGLLMNQSHWFVMFQGWNSPNRVRCGIDREENNALILAYFRNRDQYKKKSCSIDDGNGEELAYDTTGSPKLGDGVDFFSKTENPNFACRRGSRDKCPKQKPVKCPQDCDKGSKPKPSADPAPQKRTCAVAREEEPKESDHSEYCEVPPPPPPAPCCPPVQRHSLPCQAAEEEPADQASQCPCPTPACPPWSRKLRPSPHPITPTEPCSPKRG